MGDGVYTCACKEGYTLAMTPAGASTSLAALHPALLNGLAKLQGLDKEKKAKGLVELLERAEQGQLNMKQKEAMLSSALSAKEEDDAILDADDDNIGIGSMFDTLTAPTYQPTTPTSAPSTPTAAPTPPTLAPTTYEPPTEDVVASSFGNSVAAPSTVCVATHSPTQVPTKSPTRGPNYSNYYGTRCTSECGQDRILSIVTADECPLIVVNLPACNSCSVTCGGFCAAQGECGTTSSTAAAGNNCGGAHDIYTVNCVDAVALKEIGQHHTSHDVAAMLERRFPRMASLSEREPVFSDDPLHRLDDLSAESGSGSGSGGASSRIIGGTGGGAGGGAGSGGGDSGPRSEAVEGHVDATVALMLVETTAENAASDSIALAAGMMCAVGIAMLLAIQMQRRRRRYEYKPILG
jgi:hypothetical protein